MPQYQIQMQHRFSSSPQAVFDFFADHERFGRIWPGQTRRIKPGQDSPNGLGSVRQIKVGPVTFEETTVVHEPAQRLEYTITRGSPLRNHRGRIVFKADGEGCLVDYQIEFDGKFPLIGALVARNLPKDFKAGLAALASELP